MSIRTSVLDDTHAHNKEVLGGSADETTIGDEVLPKFLVV